MWIKDRTPSVQCPTSNVYAMGRRALAVGCGALLLFFLLPACRSNYLNENDRLRARVMELETQAADLKARTEAAEKRLEVEVQKQSAGQAELPEGVAPPHTSRIEIIKPSRGADTDGDGQDDAVRIYLATYDQRNRFLQTLATATATIAAVPAGKEAVTVATKEIDAKEFDTAYRAGGDAHYTLEIPITNPIPQGVDQLTVTLKLTDLLTGATHETQKIVNFATGGGDK